MDGYTPNSSSLLANDDLYPTTNTNTRSVGNNASAGATTNMTSSGTGINTVSHAHAGTGRIYPVVQVVAPENLSEGYTFDVEVNHEILTITVPYGGVKKGQTFNGQTQAQIQDERTTTRVPVGGWKDSLFDFCAYGPFHPLLIMTICCPLIALGQIYTRLNLNWHGRPIEQEYETTSTSDTNTTILTPQYKYSSRAFKTTIAITILFKIIIPQLDPNRDVHTSQSFASDPYIHYSEILFLILCAILIARTRTYIRRRYDIQATIIEESIERAPCSCCRNLEDNDSVPFGCDVVEDYAISFLCGPCVLMQMSRHTAPYDTYEGSCCSSNGLPSHAPSMI